MDEEFFAFSTPIRLIRLARVGDGRSLPAQARWFSKGDEIHHEYPEGDTEKK
jgi:hypothetical protein